MTDSERLEQHLHEQLREINERARREAELAALRPMAPLVVHTCLLCHRLVAPGLACPACNP